MGLTPSQIKTLKFELSLERDLIGPFPFINNLTKIHIILKKII